MPLPAWAAAAAASAAGAAAGQGMGMLGTGIGARAANRRNYHAQKKMNERVNKPYAEWMANLQAQKDYEMWVKTGPQGMKQQLKEAGLNPALMYGMSGAGGGTMGNSGSTGQSQASDHDGGAGAGMAIGAQIAAQAAQAQAQTELIKAQTKNVNADTENKQGLERDKTRMEIEDLAAGVENKRAQTQLTRVQKDLQQIAVNIGNETYEQTVDKVIAEADLAKNTYDRESLALNEDRATYKIKIETTRQLAINAVLQNALLRAQTEKTQADTEKTKAEVAKWAEELSQGWTKLSIEEQRLKLDTIKGKLQAMPPGKDRYIWKDAWKAIEELDDMLKVNEPNTK